MTQQGKRLQMPVYLLSDTKRPLPNFLVDTTAYATTLFAWTDMEKAVDYATNRGLSHFDITVYHTEQVFRGVLGEVLDRHPTVEWLHWDPHIGRRAPRRFKIDEILKQTSKENG